MATSTEGQNVNGQTNPTFQMDEIVENGVELDPTGHPAKQDQQQQQEDPASLRKLGAVGFLQQSLRASLQKHSACAGVWTKCILLALYFT
ncbi:hypothetical protein ACOMHN_006088 [Nucella lapillus]